VPCEGGLKSNESSPGLEELGTILASAAAEKLAFTTGTAAEMSMRRVIPNVINAVYWLIFMPIRFEAVMKS
jgi:hypothetical protein